MSCKLVSKYKKDLLFETLKWTTFNLELLDKSKKIDLGYSSFDLLLKIIRLTSFVVDLDICMFSFIWEISKNKFLSSNVSKFTDLVSLFTKEETLKKLSSLL